MPFKIIISGATGRIGSQVLDQALRNPSITDVIALSRRPLPDLEHISHLEVVLLDDFKTHPNEIISNLSDADGCVW
jgi:uncharacterized protein YbjT (DUF2867 family)